jgi:hypothetical protein
MKKQKLVLGLILAGLLSLSAGAMAKGDSGVDTGNPKGNPTDHTGDIIKEIKPGITQFRLGAGPDELGPKVMKRKPALNA